MLTKFRRMRSSHSVRMMLALGDQFVLSGTRFITSWMIARYCGAEQLGFYALGFSVLVIIDLLLQAFVSAPYTIYAQRAAGIRLLHYTGNSFRQAMAVGAMGVGVFLVAGMIAGLSEAVTLSRVMYVLSIGVMFCVLREFARRHCFAAERIGLAFIVDSTFSLVQLAVMYIAYRLNSLNAVTAHAAGGLACLVALGIWLVMMRKSMPFGSQRWRLHLLRHWKFGRWVFVTQTTNQLNWNMVQWIIAYWLSAEATGVFTGCLTIAFLSNPFVLGIANLIYPRLAVQFIRQSDLVMQRSALKTAAGVGVVMVSFTLLLLFFGQFICDMLYADPVYADASLILGCLAGAVSCLAVTMPIDASLWARQRTDLSSAASAVGLCATTVAVLMLVRLGVKAAAFGLLLGCVIESVARIVFFVRTRQFDKPNPQMVISGA